MMAIRQAIVRPLLLGGLLAAGAGVVLGIVVLCLIAMVHEWLAPGRNEFLVIRDDGTPLIVSGPDYRTLEGAPVAGNEQIRQLWGLSFAVPRPEPPVLFQMSWQQRLRSFNDGLRPATFWYFIHDGRLEGSGYFAGFNAESKLRVGYIGAHGFRAERPPAEDRIPVDGELMSRGAAFDAMAYQVPGREPRYYGGGEERVFLVSGNRLLEVNFPQRSVQVVLTADKILAINTRDTGIAYNARLVWDAGVAFARVAVCTPEKIIILEYTKLAQRSFVLPAEVRGRSLTVYQLPANRVLLNVSRTVAGDRRHNLYWIDPAGTILRHQEVVFPAPSFLDKPAGTAWWYTAVASAPVVDGILMPGYVSDLPGDEFFLAYRDGLPHAWLPLTLDLVLAAVMAWLCYRRQKRFAQPWTKTWVVFVFLGGVAGLLGYLWHRRWPPLFACPSCGRPAPRDREHCARCGAEFPAPAPKGIEVFA
jgi:hypothetical protein